MKFINYNIFFLYSKRLFLLLSIFFINFSKLKSQNYNFPDLYSEKILFNPAYSGLSNLSEININYSTNILYDLYSVSYNHFIEKYNSGTGLLISNKRLGKGAINNFKISCIYNYRVKINYKSIVNTAVEISYIEQSINSDKLIFSNQINPITQTISSNNTEFYNNTYRTYDFSFGTSYISNKYRAGLSIHHTDKIFTSSKKNIIKPLYSANFGKIFSVTFLNKKQNLIITPEIIWQSQNNFHQIYYIVHGIYNIFLTRIFLKQNLNFNTIESGISIGLNYTKFRLTYTYNISFTKYLFMPVNTNGISLRYNFGKQKKINFRNTIYCSDF